MRPTVLALVALLAFPALTGIPPAGVASAATVSYYPGIYHPVDRVRALDTRNTGAIPAFSTVAVRVSGRAEVPAADVVAISANLTVLNPGSTGSLSAFADGTSWSGAATMSFQAGQTAQNFETIPVIAGMIDIRNNTAGPLNVVVDLLGYHLYATAGDTKGRYQPMSPTRLLDTRTGQPLAAGDGRNFQVASVAGIPPVGSSPGTMAAVLNFTVLSPSQPGSLTVVGGRFSGNTPSLSFAAGQNEQGQILMGLDDSGALRIVNNSGAAIQVIADAVGYYTGLFLDNDQFFWAGRGWGRVYDSRAYGSKPVPPGGTVSVDIWSASGKPTRILTAGSFNVTVLSPTTSGSVSVWPNGDLWDGAGTVSFTAGKTIQRGLMAKAGEEDVLFRNNSSAPITLIVDINGWSTT